MNFLSDRQNRQYLRILSVLAVCMTALLLFYGSLELFRSRELVFLREQQIVSSLLMQGVPAGQIAAACAAEELTEEGHAFLRQIGHQSQTPMLAFSYLRKELCSVYVLGCLMTGIALCMAFLLSAVWYLRQRDRLYQEAFDRILHFMEGDFSAHLTRNDQSGTLFCLFSSIDQLARALKAGSEAEHTSREFLKHTISDISHQLKTPLAALNLYTDIILAEPDHPDTVREFSRRSMRSLLRMEELIQAMLKIVRLDAGSITFEPVCLSVRDLVLRAAEPLFARAGQEQKQIRITGDPREMLFCDPAWTAEALGNLIKNALDHTTIGCMISVYWERSPVMLRISVEDNGCGIAQEDIHHIFKRFYRSRRSSNRQGAGLGLPLARAIIEEQGGILSVTSEEGRGTVFSASFPEPKSECPVLTKS